MWAFLANPAFRNHLYTGQRESVLWPQHNVRDLVLWAEVYLSGQDGCRSDSSANQGLDLDVETGMSYENCLLVANFIFIKNSLK